MTDTSEYIVQHNALTAEVWAKLESLHTSLINLHALECQIDAESKTIQRAIEAGISISVQAHTVDELVRQSLTVISQKNQFRASASGCDPRGWDAEFFNAGQP